METKRLSSIITARFLMLILQLILTIIVLWSRVSCIVWITIMKIWKNSALLFWGSCTSFVSWNSCELGMIFGGTSWDSIQQSVMNCTDRKYKIAFLVWVALENLVELCHPVSSSFGRWSLQSTALVVTSEVSTWKVHHMQPELLEHCQFHR